MQARRLVPRADRHEDAQGVGAGGPDVLSDDLETVWEHGTADGAIQLGKAPSGTAARHGGHRVLIRTPLRRDRLLNHRNQRQLAAIVDLVDLYLDLLSDAEHILDALDSLSPGEWTHLGDVQQAVLPGSSATKAPKAVILTTVPRYRSPFSGLVGLAMALIMTRAASALSP